MVMSASRAAARLRQAVSRLGLAVAVLATAVAAERAWHAWQQAQANRHMAAGTAPPRAAGRVVFAQALALQRAGRQEEALAAYAEAEAAGDAALRLGSQVNVANLYLAAGIAAAQQDGNATRAITFVQLAKSGYRRALRERPDDWNTRYNLELAQRLVPDYEARQWRQSGNETEVQEALKRDRAAWTEMVGTPRGLH